MFFKVKISFQRTLDLIIRTWNWELTWRYRSWRAAVLSDMTSLKTKELLTICWLAMFSLSKGKKWPQDPGAERKPIKPSFLIGKTGTRAFFVGIVSHFDLALNFTKLFSLYFKIEFCISPFSLFWHLSNPKFYHHIYFLQLENCNRVKWKTIFVTVSKLKNCHLAFFKWIWFNHNLIHLVSFEWIFYYLKSSCFH